MRVEASMKISRKMAVLEFSSSNGYSSFTLEYECRRISIVDTGDGNQINFSYLVKLPYYVRWACEERGYEEWVVQNNFTIYYLSEWYDCKTTFQGQKCSIMYLCLRSRILGKNSKDHIKKII